MAKKSKKKSKKPKPLIHDLVPKHELLSKKDTKKLLEKYNITLLQFPKISKDDPAIAHLDVKILDLIKITRKSPTAGKSTFYRVVVDE
ncbi:MAG: DNA-directed RNA polymerase subunit H [Candidatus Woesearchaeota archaeon]|nr:DNA-directed RNA polymerase subunit H [Candidatus Woesearchaeota archaeon]